MKKIKIESPQDLLEIVKRRKWILLVPFILVSIATALVAFNIPNIYRSETMIIVENQKVPTSVVPNVGETDTMDRLKTLRQQVFSRTYLASVVKEFNLYSDFQVRMTDDQKIMALHRATNMEDAIGKDSKVAFFRLAYENKDPYIAQKVTARLASLFIEYDNRKRLEEVLNTLAFLEAEVKKIEKGLQEYEAKVRVVRVSHIDALPENLQTNISTLQMLRDQKTKAVESLDRSQTLLIGLKKDLSSEKQYLDKVDKTVKPAEKLDENDPDYIQQRLDNLKERLAKLRERYTDSHPDVAELIKKVEQLEVQLKKVGKKGPAPGKGSERTSKVVLEPNPRYLELQKNIREVEDQIDLRTREIERLAKDIDEYSTRVKDTPHVVEVIKGLDRTYSGLTDKYNEMSKKLDVARLAGSLAQKQKGDQFRIQDPASLPMAPAKPNRPLVMLVGALVGLGLGVVLVLLGEYFDQKIRSRKEVEGMLGLPVLVEIPEILNHRELTVKRMKRALAFSFSMALFAVAVVALIQIFSKNYQVIIEYVILSGFI
jgi:polysaccharide chain length determinant protein (PEP-CTERM system associated)